MPIRVHKPGWQDATRHTTVEYDGERARVDFYYKRITPQMVEKVQSQADDITTLCETLELIIHSWDVLGEPPLTRDQFEAELAGVLGIEPVEEEELAIAGAHPGPAMPNGASYGEGTYPYAVAPATPVYDKVTGVVIERPSRAQANAISKATPQAQGVYPTDAFALMQMPLEFLSTVTEAIFASAIPNATKTARR